MIEIRRASASLRPIALVADEVSDLREDWVKRADCRRWRDHGHRSRPWIIDDTGLPKKGAASVGAARQYCRGSSASCITAKRDAALALAKCSSARLRANLVYRDFTRVGAGNGAGMQRRRRR